MNHQFVSEQRQARSTLRSTYDYNHVRQQSWNNLTSSCVNLSIKRDPSANEVVGQPAPQKKRRVDGSVKEESTWELSELEHSLPQEVAEASAGQLKLSMDMDLLRRRIAVIQAHEKGKELRASASGQLHNSRLRNKTWSWEQADDMLDWKEGVLR